MQRREKDACLLNENYWQNIRILQVIYDSGPKDTVVFVVLWNYETIRENLDSCIHNNRHLQ